MPTLLFTREAPKGRLSVRLVQGALVAYLWINGQEKEKPIGGRVVKLPAPSETSDGTYTHTIGGDTTNVSIRDHEYGKIERYLPAEQKAQIAAEKKAEEKRAAALAEAERAAEAPPAG